MDRLSGNATATGDKQQRDLFAQTKRAEVRIPGFLAYVDVDEATSTRGAEVVDAVLHAGATCVALREYGVDGTGGGNSGKKLYEAATTLKTLVRGRACVLIVDRTDIAASAELDGVVLTDDGVPTVVARKALPETAVVAHESESAEEAEKAIERGLNFLISNQNKDGSWSSKDLEKGEGSGYAIGGTSLGLMAFMVGKGSL